MEIPFQRWYPAIQNRHSRRRYNPSHHIPPDIVADVQSACNSFRPFSGARVELITAPPDKIFKLILGSYGFISGAPMALAFIGQGDKAGVPESVGYTGEGIILEATALGLSTCWVAGFFRPAVVAEFIQLNSGDKVPAVSPLGYAVQSRTFGERMAGRFARSRQRHSLSTLTSGLPESEWQPWVKAALETARLAPSAANRQPWRFQVGSNSITVSTDSGTMGGNVSRRLDCGIAMMHLEVAALYHGIRGKWESLKAPQVARYCF